MSELSHSLSLSRFPLKLLHVCIYISRLSSLISPTNLRSSLYLCISTRSSLASPPNLQYVCVYGRSFTHFTCKPPQQVCMYPSPDVLHSLYLQTSTVICMHIPPDVLHSLYLQTSTVEYVCIYLRTLFTRFTSKPPRFAIGPCSTAEYPPYADVLATPCHYWC